MNPYTWLPQSRRQLLRFTILVLLVIVIGWIGYTLLLRPVVTVEAPTGSSVEITDIATGATAARTTLTSTSAALQVDSGSYKVTVTSGTAKQFTYANLKLLQRITFKPTVAAPLNTAIVGQVVAYNVIRTGNTITYLDTTKRLVETLDSQGRISGLGTTESPSAFGSGTNGPAQAFRPIANHQAIVENDGNLYVLRGNQLLPLQPIDGLATPAIYIIGTNPNQASFAVSVNEALYWYDSPDAKPVKVLTLAKRIDQLVIGGTTVLAYSTRMPASIENIRASYSSYAVDPIVVNVHARSQRIFTTGPIVDASLSNDGSLATIEGQRQPTTDIYTVATGSVLQTIENPVITTPYWLDNHQFVYGRSGNLWLYDTTSHEGRALATIPTNSDITSVTYDPSELSYYVTTYDSEAKALVYRINDGDVNHTAEQVASLAINNPNHDSFRLTYNNVTQPTLRISTTVISNSPSLSQFRALTSVAQQQAHVYLTSNGVDLNNLTILYDPSL